MAFYQHFEDREALLKEVIERGFTRFLEVVVAARDAHDDPRERLLAMGLAYLAFVREDPASPGARAFGALVEAVTACRPDLEDPRLVALGPWTILHGFAGLTATRPGMGWPDAPTYARALMDRWLS